MGDQGRRPTPGGLPGDAGAFGIALTQAMTAAGFTLSGLRDRLAEEGTPVSLAALSYWRSGRSQPERQTSLQAVASIEAILGVAEGELACRLLPTRRGLPRDPPVGWELVSPHTDPLKMAVAAIGGDNSDDMSQVSLEGRIEVDADRRERCIRIVSTIRAVADLFYRVPLILIAEEPGQALQVAPGFRALAGCKEGRCYHDPEGGVFGVELLLDGVIGRGETTLIEHAFDLPLSDPPTRQFEQYFRRRIGHLMLWAQFDRTTLPKRCESYTVVDGVETTVPITVRGSTSVHVVLSDFGPGLAGIRWEW